MKKILIIFLVVVGGVLLWLSFSSTEPQVVEVSDSIKSVIEEETETSAVLEIEVPADEIEEKVIETEESDEADEESEPQVKLSIPKEVEIKVPYIVQAPFADWNEFYKEACEEASLLMVHNFYQNVDSLTENEMKISLDEAIAWGLEEFGSYDTTANETAQFFLDYLGYDQSRVHVVYDITIDDIKAILSEGYPVIVPAAGRELGNKYFRDPGPLYHMLVIKGYDKDEFITNDPGTKRGEGYVYKQDVLYSAIHDLTEDLEKITEGRKVMIVIKPE